MVVRFSVHKGKKSIYPSRATISYLAARMGKGTVGRSRSHHHSVAGLRDHYLAYTNTDLSSEFERAVAAR